MPLAVNPKRLERELKRLQYELKVAQRQTPYLRGMIEGTHDRLALLNEHGEIVEYNSAFASQFALEEDLVIYGRSISTIYSTSASSVEAVEQPLITEESLADHSLGRCYGYLGAEAVEVELSRFQIQEAELIVLSARPLDDKGKSERELNTVRRQLDELKERLSLEREQERAQRVEALTLLAGMLAHDLNNALAVVCGNLDLLEMALSERDLLVDEELETISDIREGIASAQGLSEKLKTFTKGESAELKPLNYNVWLTGIARALAKAHQDRLHLTLPDEELWLNADESQLSQLVINIVSNAFQAMAEAGVRPTERVTLTLRRVGAQDLEGLMFSSQHPLKLTQGYALLSVLDCGPGIPDSNLKKIFDPFFSTKPQGSGIGLASALKVAFGHRGGISAENHPEGGACFKVAIPLITAPRMEPCQPMLEPLVASSLEGVIALIMDDEPHVRQTIKKVLKRAQAQVMEAESGEELLALQAQLTHQAQLVYILDLNIEGGRSGVEVLRALKSVEPSSLVIACSGYFPLEETSSYHQLGFDGFISKPFTSDELIQAVYRVLKGGSA